MEVDEFITFVEDLHEADSTGCAGEARTFFRAIYIGYEYPNLHPPKDDETAMEGYELGLSLRKEYHEKFK
jgi:hypothetical protein